MNFEKDLRQFKDDELYEGINRHDPKYMSLLSDELTRRSTDRWSQKIVELTILLFFIGLIQLIILLKSISSSLVEWLIFIIMIFFSILYFIRLMKKEMERLKK